MRSTQTIQVLLVDDHPAVRQGLVLLLAPEGIHICAEAATRADAADCLERVQPDLAIVDLSLDREDGLGIIADLKRRGVPVLVYSMHQDALRVGSAFAAGALGYVTKRELCSVLVDAIGEVAGGRRFVSPVAAAALAEGIAEAPPALAKLSRRELEIYRLLGRGEATPEIASALELSAHTVESYYARMRDKLGAGSMLDLRRSAIDHFHKCKELP